jgi:phosphoenolpyruvate carboxylase
MEIENNKIELVKVKLEDGQSNEDFFKEVLKSYGVLEMPYGGCTLFQKYYTEIINNKYFVYEDVIYEIKNHVKLTTNIVCSLTKTLDDSILLDCTFIDGEFDLMEVIKYKLMNTKI